MFCFFLQKIELFGKNSIFTQNNSIRALFPSYNVGSTLKQRRVSTGLELCSTVFNICNIKGYCNENVSFTDHTSGIRLPDSSKLARNWKNNWRHNLLPLRHRQYSVGVAVFLLSGLVTGPSLMSISLLVLELWQFSFMRDWREIQKLEISPSTFCPISGDWGE